MIEKIYTIPVNEAFDLYDGCPFCALYKRLEMNEIDIILGASMMEPDIRIKTNEQGFCEKHYVQMFAKQNRLGLALMLESHLSEEIIPDIKGGALAKLFKPAADNKKIDKQVHSCYVCGRVKFSLGKMMENTALLWEKEREFKEKLSKQPYFCVRHYSELTNIASYTLSKKINADFSDSAKSVMLAYAEKLLADVSWYIKKFDYRYEDEPWNDSKDAVERALKFL